MADTCGIPNCNEPVLDPYSLCVAHYLFTARPLAADAEPPQDEDED